MRYIFILLGIVSLALGFYTWTQSDLIAPSFLVAGTVCIMDGIVSRIAIRPKL